MFFDFYDPSQKALVIYFERKSGMFKKENKMDSIISKDHPSDNKNWDCQCARCGSSMEFEECWNCGGTKFSYHDCGEDCCCCLDPEDNVICDICDGDGGWLLCISSPEWCQANPLGNRENIKSSTPEWFYIDNEK